MICPRHGHFSGAEVFYKEEVIDGVLMFRTSFDTEWRKCPDKIVVDRIVSDLEREEKP